MMDDADWGRLVRQIRAGHCTPFLGAGACAGTLPDGPRLAMDWADRHHYPFLDRGDLARVMQYASIAVGDAVFVKEQLCEELERRGRPDFNVPGEPHALLARFPISVFVTTNYDDFLYRALEATGKKPTFAISPWMTRAGRPGADPDEQTPVTKPDPERPLVFHLHGRYSSPPTLVLTEDDYLEFLANITAVDEGRVSLLPSVVHAAMADYPLLFIGYSLRDWTFRVLFQGLLRSRPELTHRRHVSVQLLPPLDRSVADAEERAMRYMDRYLERGQVSIYWGTAQEFCAELRARLDAG